KVSVLPEDQRVMGACAACADGVRSRVARATIKGQQTEPAERVRRCKDIDARRAVLPRGGARHIVFAVNRRLIADQFRERVGCDLFDITRGFNARELVRQQIRKRSLSGNGDDLRIAGSSGLLPTYGKRRRDQTRYRRKREKPFSMLHSCESLLVESSD